MRAPTCQTTLRAFQSRTSPIYASVEGHIGSSYMRTDGRQGYVIDSDRLADNSSDFQLRVREFDGFCS